MLPVNQAATAECRGGGAAATHSRSVFDSPMSNADIVCYTTRPRRRAPAPAPVCSPTREAGDLFFRRPNQPFHVRAPFWIMVAGESLGDARVTQVFMNASDVGWHSLSLTSESARPGRLGNCRFAAASIAVSHSEVALRGTT